MKIESMNPTQVYFERVYSKYYWVFFLTTLLPYTTQGREWEKEKGKEKQSHQISIELNQGGAIDQKKSSRNEEDWMMTNDDFLEQDELEIDAPANPDDPDTPIDKHLVFLIFAALLLGFTLKNRRIENYPSKFKGQEKS